MRRRPRAAIRSILGPSIVLTGSTQPIDNATAGVSLIIDGQGYAVDGQDVSGTRPFSIHEDTVVTMQNITVTGGNVAVDGGGILNRGTLSILYATVAGNSTGPNGYGGGVETYGPLTVDHSTFDSNVSGYGGGGIHSQDRLSSLVVTFSTFIANTSDIGGAIYADGVSSLAVSDSLFTANVSGNGGGIAARSNQATAIVANSTFSDNTTELSNTGFGGGIANSDGTMIVNNSTLVGNKAAQGGGIATGYFFCFTADVQVLMADGTQKRIADIAVGDELLSYDFETGEQVTSTVQATFSHEVDEFLRINDLEVTGEHPFAVGDDQWVKARDLQIGNHVMSDEGWTTITSIEHVQKTADVYTVNVDGPHNFYVTDGTSQYLVHNKLQDLQDGETEVNNTIITDSTGGDCYASSAVFSGSNNLIDDFAAGDCSSTSTAAVTNLGPLANNGGPTQTFALMGGSNAINGGDNNLANGPSGALTTDQRGAGFPRIVDTTVDVGAYEAQGGRLTIAKVTYPAGGTDFPFTIDPGPITLTSSGGTNGGGNGAFLSPIAVAIDAAGNVYVADTGTTASRSSTAVATTWINGAEWRRQRPVLFPGWRGHRR